MKKFFKRQWPLLGLGALLAMVAFYLATSGGMFLKVPLLKDLISGEGLMLRDIHYTHNDPDKKVKWVLDAKKVKFSGDKSRIFFHDFRLRVEQENRSWYRLKGKKGDYSRASGEINLWGDLEGTSNNGYRILTQHMLINEKKGTLRTEDRVKIFGPLFSIEGQGLFVDLDKEKLKIMSDVTTTVRKES
ncbi:MAG: LPS export ABC transporter periplasmic protein LptC [Desulfobacteraceae bacterium]|nr:LPS export ABC transporter periplasmic protein LptC [Desulfobacteraceae bacterium]